MVSKLFQTIVSLLFIFALILGCAGDDQAVKLAEQKMTAEGLAKNIETLASDEFEGRGPSSRGEIKTINFLKDEFQKFGLKPGNVDSYFQDVPLVAITADPSTKLTINGQGWQQTFSYGEEFMAWTKRVVGKVSIRNSEMVFVGYGVVAPEYNWNDYAGLDVKGKTVVILVNDPGYATQDPLVFKGNSMTYYGRWTYKYEEAARQGAAGALIVHETGPAGYPWEVVTGSWSGAQFDLVSEDNNMSRCSVEGWITHDSARLLFEKAELDFEQLKGDAAKPNFKAVPLAMTAGLTLQNNIEHSDSKNVIAVLPGSQRPDEHVFYVAHWDHFGMDTSKEGDNIYNGALDNATGTAGLIELTKAFTALEKPPERSIAFLAVTAEEQGLLGSKHYAENPIYPVTKTVAAINMDGLNIYGKMKDVTIIGYGNSDLDDYLRGEAAKQTRVVRPDPEPEKGYFYRSDHFSFAKQGIPSLYADKGIDHVEHGAQWTLEQDSLYTAERYHKPSDEFDPNWDLSGAIDDLKLLFRVGHRLSNESTFPNWKEGTEFKAKRDADMAGGTMQSSK
ncbi:M28 family metallopeptidase [bacterium]|nr:M28 family metallopeptidase [bacterium]